MIHELSASELRRTCDPETLQFQGRGEIGHVHAIMPAGNWEDGEFASDAVYGRVDRRLAEMAEEMASFDNKGERHETSMDPASP